MSRIEPRFRGYIEGLRAGNLATVRSSVDFHIARILPGFDEVINRLKAQSSEGLSEAESARAILGQSSTGDLSGELIRFGEALVSMLRLYPNTFVQRESSAIVDQMRKVVYHYAEIARLVEDDRITDLALAVGRIFTL